MRLQMCTFIPCPAKGYRPCMGGLRAIGGVRHARNSWGDVPMRYPAQSANARYLAQNAHRFTFGCAASRKRYFAFGVSRGTQLWMSAIALRKVSVAISPTRCRNLRALIRPYSVVRLIQVGRDGHCRQESNKRSDHQRSSTQASTSKQ